MLLGLWAQMDPRNHVLDGVQIPHGKGQFWGKGAPIVKYTQLNSTSCNEGVNSSLSVSLWH